MEMPACYAFGKVSCSTSGPDLQLLTKHVSHCFCSCQLLDSMLCILLCMLGIQLCSGCPCISPCPSQPTPAYRWAFQQVHASTLLHD